MPSFEPKKFVTSIPKRSFQPTTMAADSGAEPEPITRIEEKSAAARSCSLASSIVSRIGGATVYDARSRPIWPRKTGSAMGWCMTSVPATWSQGTNMPPMPDMLTIGNGLRSTSPSVSRAPSVVP